MTPLLTLHLLGPPEMRFGATPLTAETISAKGQALLAYLALTGRPVSRSALAGLLWGDLPEESARANLRGLLTRLRRVLPPEMLLVERQQVSLAPEGVALDVSDFEESCADDGRAAEAVALYRGDFLEGFAAPNAPDFDEWAAAQRERLRQTALDALYRLAAQALARRNFEAGIAAARRLLELEPWLEEGHRLLVELLARSGQRSQALAQYDACRRLLETELGVAPGPETEALVEAIRQGRLEAEPAAQPAAPPAPAPGPPPTNLPAPLTPFVGREQERARLAARLRDPSYRLVTIVGEGGMGKTRLALEAGAEMLATPDFPDGVWFVPLAAEEQHDAARAEDAIATAIAAALGLAFATGDPPARQVRYWLREKRCLLLLDNFELLSAGAGFVLALLTSAPGVTILATSRVPLHLQAEYLLRLEGLELPVSDDATALASESVRLFAERAERSAGRPIVDEQTLPATVAICRFVAGLPLAIELAAAACRYLSPQAIFAGLQAHYDALATTMGDVAPRHRSLRAVLDASWAMLSPDEQAAFARLSIFHRGFRLDAAQQVAGAPPTTVFALLDRSLVHHLGPDYYGLHEIARRYARERLAEMALDLATLAERHAVYYLTEAARQVPALRGPSPQDALHHLQTDAENLAQAWHEAATRPLPAALAAGVMSMVEYWTYSGLFDEGERALALALDHLAPAAGPPLAHLLARLHAERAALLFELGRLDEMQAAVGDALHWAGIAADPALLGWARLYQGHLEWRRGDYEAAGDALQQAATLAQEVGDAALEGAALRGRAAVAWRQGDIALAQQLGRRSLERLQDARDVRGEARSRHFLAILALNRQDYAYAQRQLEPLLHTARMLGDRRLELGAYAEMAQVATKRGDFAAAMDYYARERALAEELGIAFQIGSNLTNSADLLLRMGDLAGARANYERALALFREQGATQAESHVLAFLGLLAAFEGRYDDGEATSRQALALAQQVPSPREMALARSFLARNLAGQQRWAEAAEQYALAEAGWQHLGEPGRRLEMRAGQAYAALALGEGERAAALAREVADALAAGPLLGADDPEWVEQIVEQVLGRAVSQ